MCIFLSLSLVFSTVVWLICVNRHTNVFIWPLLKFLVETWIPSLSNERRLFSHVYVTWRNIAMNQKPFFRWITSRSHRSTNNFGKWSIRVELNRRSIEIENCKNRRMSSSFSMWSNTTSNTTKRCSMPVAMLWCVTMTMTREDWPMKVVIRRIKSSRSTERCSVNQVWSRVDRGKSCEGSSRSVLQRDSSFLVNWKRVLNVGTRSISMLCERVKTNCSMNTKNNRRRNAEKPNWSMLG